GGVSRLQGRRRDARWFRRRGWARVSSVRRGQFLDELLRAPCRGPRGCRCAAHLDRKLRGPRAECRNDQPEKEVKLQFDEEGDGPLVVLLHGFPESRATWKHQIRALA